MNKLFFGLAIFAIGLSSCGSDELSKTDEDAIRKVFKMTEDAWNEGNIETFMEGYWKSDMLVFVGAQGPVYGYQATMERYRKNYPGQEAMGKLSFDILDIRKIDKNTVIFIGKFHLSRTIGDMQGHYTLIWKKIDGRWVIIADHSSAEAA
jgi:uncharacterized protein (TIGR02246 family)